MTVYMIRVSDYTASSEINCHFCFTYVFSFIIIDVETDEVCRSEDVEGTKHTPCLNFYYSMMVYLIRVSDYSTSSKINWRFCFIYAFSSVEIDVEIDKVHRSEDFDGTKYAFYLDSRSSITVT
jgi:hypothetical protein